MSYIGLIIRFSNVRYRVWPCWNPVQRLSTMTEDKDTSRGMKHRLSEHVKVNLSGDLTKAELRIPGFGVDDMDRALNVAPWKVAKIGETGRLTAFGFMGWYGPNALYRMEQLNKERLTFLVSNCMHISPNLYKPGLQFEPVRYNISLLNVGRSSITQLDELSLLGTGEILTQSIVKLVFVDIQTRKAVDLPGWFTDSFSKIKHPVPTGIDINERLGAVDPPSDCYLYRTRIQYSDLDYYFHANHASYVRIVCDAANSASVEGKLRLISGDLAFKHIKKMHFLYQGETAVGDNVEVLVWQHKDNPKVILCQLQKDGKAVFLSKFEYDLPDVLKISNL